jgi:hypothetical protein
MFEDVFKLCFTVQVGLLCYYFLELLHAVSVVEFFRDLADRVVDLGHELELGFLLDHGEIEAGDFFAESVFFDFKSVVVSL